MPSEAIFSTPNGNSSVAALDNNRNVKVFIAGGGSPGGTSSVDEAPFTPGTTAGTPAMGTVNPVDTPPNGALAIVALDGARNLKVNVVAGTVGGTSSTDETGFTAGFSKGTPLMGVVNPSDTPANGDLAIGALDGARNVKVNVVAGSITVTPPTSNTVSAAGPSTIGASSATLLAANALRKRLILQNVGTTRILILFGAGSASASNYHIALPAGGNSNDGSSAPYVDQLWTGAIQAISSAAGGSVQAMEFT